MDIKQKLIDEHSKKQTNAIIKYVGSDKKRFKILLDLFLGNDSLVSQRAGWPLSYICIENPNLIKPHLSKLVKNLLRKKLHDAVIRNTLRLLKDIEIPKKDCVQVFDLCIGYSKNTRLPNAIRAFAIQILGHICKKFPELAPEVKLIIAELKTFPQPPSIAVSIKWTSEILLNL